MKSRNVLKLLCTLVVLFSLNEAFARGRSRIRAYSFFEDGGKHSQAICDGESKVPPRLKTKSEFKTKSYRGSEELEFDAHAQEATAAWKHYYTSLADCNAVLARQPKPK